MRIKLHRYARAVTLTLAALASLLLAHARASAETYWLDGNEVEVTFKPMRQSFVLGEPIELMLWFENRSDTAVELLLSSSAGRGWPDDFDVRVTGPDGKALPPLERSGEGRDGDSYLNSFLPVRSSAQMGVLSSGVGVSLKNWTRPEKPGRYKVSLRRGVVAGPYNGKYRLWPETTKPGVELRLETEFTIVESGGDDVGALVEELSVKTLACDRSPMDSPDAAGRLAALDDERAVKPLAEAVAKCRNASVKYPALQALAKFPTDAAFEALRAASTDADEDFRTVVAQTVARNKHPKAYALLLSMRRDTYYGVRLMVLNALEAEDTEASRRLIWEMTNDEHPLIKNEALRFLQQRPAPSRP
jgi:hypothetical protein